MIVFKNIRFNKLNVTFNNKKELIILKFIFLL